MTRADRLAIARYLHKIADALHTSHYWPERKRVVPYWIRDEIAQLRKWAKMLREDK